jgi:hypothetical protein
MSRSFEDAFVTLIEKELSTVKAQLISLKQTLHMAGTVLGGDYLAGRKELDKTLVDQGGARAEFDQLRSKTARLLSYTPEETTDAEGHGRVRALIREIKALELELLNEPPSQVENKLLAIYLSRQELLDQVFVVRDNMGVFRAACENKVAYIEAAPNKHPVAEKLKAAKETWYQCGATFDLFLMVCLMAGNALAKVRR